MLPIAILVISSGVIVLICIRSGRKGRLKRSKGEGIDLQPYPIEEHQGLGDSTFLGDSPKDQSKIKVLWKD